MTRTARVSRHMLGWASGATRDFPDYSHFVTSSDSKHGGYDDLIRETQGSYSFQERGIRVQSEKQISRLSHPSLKEKEFALAIIRERRRALALAEEWAGSSLASSVDVIYCLMSDYSDQAEKEKSLRKLEKAKDQDEVMKVLKDAGFSKQVEKLRQHLIDRKEELEDGEHADIRFESLRAVSRFLISYRDLPFSVIKVDSDGFADLEWFLSARHIENDIDNICWIDGGGGQIVLRFVTPNLIEFAMLSGPWLDDAERLSLSGTMSHSKMRVVLNMFSERIISYHE